MSPDSAAALPGGVTLVGPFWTRRQAARHLGVPSSDVASWGLISIGGPHVLEEVYPTFQFAAVGVRRDLALIDTLLLRRTDAAHACDWLFRPNPRLRDVAPIQWLTDRGSFEAVLEALPEPADGRPGTDHGEVEQVRAMWLQSAAVPGTHVGLTAPWNRVDETPR